MKRCPKCGEEKAFELFGKHSRRKDGLQSECKECRAAYNRSHYQKHRETYLASARRQHRTQWGRHRLTEGAYEALMAEHDGLCHVCLAAPAVVIDHDHACCPRESSCGECVRGVLCHPCNKGLGFFRDDLRRLRAAVDYLGR